MFINKDTLDVYPEIEDVYSYIQNTAKENNILLPKRITENVLSQFNIIRCQVKFNINQIKPYEKPVYSKPVWDDKAQTYVVECSTEETPGAKERLWNLIIKERNKKLNDTDWIELAPLHPKDKEKFLAYRQLLRDIPQMFSKPELVQFPTVPKVEHKMFNIKSINKIDAETLKNYTPKPNEIETYTNFIRDWSKTNFTLNVSYITNLATLHQFNLPINVTTSSFT